MLQMTNLRYLRLQYNIGLPELARLAGISPQQLSRLELQQVSCTPYQEERVCRAVETWISFHRERLDAVVQAYSRCRGKLLRCREGNGYEL